MADMQYRHIKLQPYDAKITDGIEDECRLFEFVMSRDKNIDKRTLWEGKYLRAIEITYEGVNGDLRQWEAVERVNCNGIAAIVPITDDGYLILIKQFRPPLNSYVIELPAGLNDMDETLEAVASRELREETGYAAKKLIPIAKGPLSGGLSGEILTVYLATGVEFKGVSGRDEAEDIEVLKVPLTGIYEWLATLVKNGNLIDLKIFGLIEMAQRYLAII